MSKLTGWKMIAAVSLLAAGTGLALAQGGGSEQRGWGPGWGMGGRHMMDGPMMGRGPMGGGGPMMGYRFDGMLDRIDGRLAFMKTELKITEAQTAQWTAFADTLRGNAETHNDMMRAMMEEMQSGAFFEKSLPDRLILQETHMEARLEQIRAVRVALADLYGVLDDAQKEAADEIVLPMMGMGHGMMRGGGRMWRNQ